jgi:ferredoxin
MELIETTLHSAGVHEELVYIERFVSPADPDRVEADVIDIASLEAPETFSLWLGGRSRTVPYVRGKTLLECAQDAGLQPSHSCESGYCGSCMAHVNTGKVRMRTHEALSERDIARGVALLCQSFPASSEPLELDNDSASFRAASAVKSSYGKRASQLAAVAVFAFMVAGTLILRFVH